MRRFIPRRFALTAVTLIVITNLGGVAFAADPPVDVEALKAQLAEAQALLEKDKASHEETAEKKRLIDEKLAAQKEREAKLFEEMKELCEQQEKLQAGSLDTCLAKIGK